MSLGGRPAAQLERAARVDRATPTMPRAQARRASDYAAAQRRPGRRAHAARRAVAALLLPHRLRARQASRAGASRWRCRTTRTMAHAARPRRRGAALRAGAQSPRPAACRGIADWGELRDRRDVRARERGSSRADRSATSRRSRARDPFDALLDIVVADDLRTGLAGPTGADDDATGQLRVEVWRDPRTVVGASDAGAHLDMIATFNYPTTHARQGRARAQLLPLEEAVHYLTDVPARLYGLQRPRAGSTGLARRHGRARPGDDRPGVRSDAASTCPAAPGASTAAPTASTT